MTTAVSLLALCFYPDSPKNAWFLTPVERQQAVMRLQVNRSGIENKTYKREQLVEAIKDWKVRSPLACRAEYADLGLRSTRLSSRARQRILGSVFAHHQVCASTRLPTVADRSVRLLATRDNASRLHSGSGRARLPHHRCDGPASSQGHARLYQHDHVRARLVALYLHALGTSRSPSRDWAAWSSRTRTKRAFWPCSTSGRRLACPVRRKDSALD